MKQAEWIDMVCAAPDIDLADRLTGGLTGLLVGDATGVPFESHARHELPPCDSIGPIPPADFQRSHRGTPPGTWSDDGAEALVLLTSLLDDDGLDLTRFGARLVAWIERGFCAIDGQVYGVGRQTRMALARLASGIDAARSGPKGERDNGNGSLMRVLPLVLWHQGGDVELMRLAARQSLPTHGHPRAQACCALYCLWARGELERRPQAWPAAIVTLRARGTEVGLDADEVQRVTAATNADAVHGSGYVLDTLWSAHQAVQRGTDYADVVRHAIALGDDTDTTACVAGGIAGLRYGASGIPAAWRATLRGTTLWQPLLRRLLVARGLAPGASG